MFIKRYKVTNTEIHNLANITNWKRTNKDNKERRRTNEKKILQKSILTFDNSTKVHSDIWQFYNSHSDIWQFYKSPFWHLTILQQSILTFDNSQKSILTSDNFHYSDIWQLQNSDICSLPVVYICSVYQESITPKLGQSRCGSGLLNQRDATDHL